MSSHDAVDPLATAANSTNRFAFSEAPILFLVSRLVTIFAKIGLDLGLVLRRVSNAKLIDTTRHYDYRNHNEQM